MSEYERGVVAGMRLAEAKIREVAEACVAGLDQWTAQETWMKYCFASDKVGDAAASVAYEADRRAEALEEQDVEHRLSPEEGRRVHALMEGVLGYARRWKLVAARLRRERDEARADAAQGAAAWEAPADERDAREAVVAAAGSWRVAREAYARTADAWSGETHLAPCMSLSAEVKRTARELEEAVDALYGVLERAGVRP